MRTSNALIDGNHRNSIFAVSALDGITPIIVTGASLTNANPAHVAIVDGNGNQITTFSSSFTVGSTVPTSVTGTVLVFNNGGSFIDANIANGFPVNIVKNDSQVGTELSPAMENGGYLELLYDLLSKVNQTPIIEPQNVGISASTNGDNTLITAKGNQKIYVYAWNLSYSGTVNASIYDGASATGNLLLGLQYGIANAGGANSVTPNFQLPIPKPYLFATSPGQNLVLKLSAGTAVGGSISYFVI